MRVIFVLYALLLTTAAIAQPGRYQAIAVPETGSSAQISGISPKVFIIDTQEGHLWTWTENETIAQDAGPPKLGTVLIYQGKLRPGNRSGDIIEQRYR